MNQEEIALRLGHIHREVKNIFQIENISGVQVFSTMARILQLSEMLDGQASDDQGIEISMPRWRVLLHLFMAERTGQGCGLTPTELSQFQQVSKNTISSLLRGLEEQGMITRETDPKDLRLFHIQLTDAGRQVVMNSAPRRIEGLNRLLSDLPAEDCRQLLALLTRLHVSMESKNCQPHPAANV